MAQVNAQDQISKLMRILGITEEEAKQVMADDKAIDRGERMPFDLPPDKEKEAKKMANCGTRKTSPIPQNKPKTKKENATKSGIIAELFEFLKDKSNFKCENTTITNAERQISFTCGENSFELTLVQKRKPK